MTHESSEPRTVPTYRLWVNEEGTILVREWASGNVEVCLRDDPSHIWRPPVRMVEERP